MERKLRIWRSLCFLNDKFRFFFVNGFSWFLGNLRTGRGNEINMLWCIQKERNQRKFEDVESLGDQLLASFIGYWFD